MKRKIVALLLSTAMIVSMAACGSDTGSSSGGSSSQSATTENNSQAADSNGGGGSTDDVVKPARIRAVINGTVFTKENGQAAFEQQYEEALGGDIDIILDTQDHSGYSDAIGRIFASGDLPDVIILPAEQYAAYATEGVLYDLTELYENAEFQSRLTSDANESLKVNGRLYGIAATRGNGCVTYVKQAWLDAVGITSLPSNFEEYYDMLLKFTNEDPDGNGKNDTYGVASAGLIGSEAPYITYLPEFFQNAYPDFLQDASGTWYDGFDTDELAAALERLQKGYQDGVIDPESLTMGTKDARNKYFADSFGVFTYWAGTWERNLMNSLDSQELPTDLVRLEPIDEMGYYIERQAAVWAITVACENPEGVFKYFIETMLDGGEIQFLWTYGAKGTHWDDVEETFTAGDTEYSFEAGEFHMLPAPEDPSSLLTKHHLDPLLTIAPLKAEFTVAAVDDVIAGSNQFFLDHSQLAPILPSAELLNEYNGDIWDIKNEVIQQVVVQGKDVNEWMEYYRTNAGSMAEQILAELNDN